MSRVMPPGRAAASTLTHVVYRSWSKALPPESFVLQIWSSHSGAIRAALPSKVRPPGNGVDGGVARCFLAARNLDVW